MEFKFIVQQRVLGLSECERLCGRGSGEIEILARQAGAPIFPGQPVSVSVGAALNMLVLSTAMHHGVELHTMAVHLHRLRSEALLYLGENISNWSFDGPDDADRQFWLILYGDRNTVRPRIVPLLEIPAGDTTRQLRYHSQGDVEHLSPSQFEDGYANRTPRFSINAHAIAAQVRSICEGSLFTARVTPTG